jgi:hypothetical protein
MPARLFFGNQEVFTVESGGGTTTTTTTTTTTSTTTTTTTVAPVLTNLVYLLDASNSASYPGTGTVWTDLSANAYTADLTGAVYSTAGGAPSIYFDGVNDYVSFAAAEVARPSTLPITWNVWYKGLGSNAPLSLFDSAPGQANVMRTRSGGSTPFAEIWNENPKVLIDGMTSTDWNQYTFVYDIPGYYGSPAARSIKYYLNGVFQETVTGTSSSDWVWTRMVIGVVNLTATPEDYLYGYINNHSLYNAELTAGQILQNYNAYKGRFGL